MKNNDLSNEKWVRIPTLTGDYAVSDKGRVKSNYKNGNSLILQPISNGQNDRDYLFVILDGKKHYIHHLVLNAFRGKRPSQHDSDHIDGNRHNNMLENLRYLHQSINRSHKGEKHAGHKLNNKAVKLIRYMVEQGHKQKDVAALLEVSCNAISSIMRGKTWSHVA